MCQEAFYDPKLRYQNLTTRNILRFISNHFLCTLFIFYVHKLTLITHTPTYKSIGVLLRFVARVKLEHKALEQARDIQWRTSEIFASLPI